MTFNPFTARGGGGLERDSPMEVDEEEDPGDDLINVCLCVIVITIIWSLCMLLLLLLFTGHHRRHSYEEGTHLKLEVVREILFSVCMS